MRNYIYIATISTILFLSSCSESKDTVVKSQKSGVITQKVEEETFYQKDSKLQLDEIKNTYENLIVKEFDTYEDIINKIENNYYLVYVHKIKQNDSWEGYFTDELDTPLINTNSETTSSSCEEVYN